MRISLNWLKEFIDLDLPVDDLAHEMTMLGLEIEAIERPGAEIRNVVVGQILSIEPHPNADKLVVCRTDVGESEPLQIVCGAKNMKAGDRVPTALVGASLPGGFEIGRRKMRGIESQGMMCSARELGLGEDHAGLLILPPDMPVGRDVVPLLGLDDAVFEIEVTPNRGDWAGMIGTARELAAFLNRSWRRPEVQLQESGRPAAELSSVTIENPDLCPRYIGRVITGVKVGPSPDWLARRVAAAGMRSINNVVDVTNYVLMETGHPLHAFDYDKLTENRIVVRTARAGETIRTIDGETRTLAPDMLVIADAKVPVAVAGVMGGLDSEVGEGTVNVLLESAYFLPASVRRTARTLGLLSEAAQRFQRGADPEMAPYAIDRAAQLIQEVAGGTIAPGQLDAYPNPVPQNEVELRFDRTKLLLGADVSPETQKNMLERLGFQVVQATNGACRFRIPTWRHDVSREADLIEEVARLHGYGNIPVTVPRVRPSERAFAPEERRLYRLRRQLVAQGLTEVMNMTFSSVDATRRAGLPTEYQDMVTLENPLSENQSTMRTALVSGLLSNVSDNLRRGASNVAIFEVGPVYRPKAGEDLPEQATRLGVALASPPGGGEKHWSRPATPPDFYDLKGYAEAILDGFGGDCQFVSTEFPVFSAGQGGQVEADGRVVGWLGEVRTEVLKAFDIEAPVFLLELELDPLMARSIPRPQFQTIPKFPPSLRDLAILVDAPLPAGDIVRTTKEAGGNLLRRVNIIDVYTGKQVPSGRKSVALSLVFQSEERTLTDAETKEACDRILAALKTAHGAELR